MVGIEDQGDSARVETMVTSRAVGGRPLPQRSSRTFVSLTGPPGNIGDALIRRLQLDWAKGASEDLVVYTGDAPDVWLRQVGVPDDATVLRSKRSIRRWLWLIATAPRRPVLIFEAGEVPLDHGNALRELVFLAETLIVRLKGGIIVRPPRGIRAPTYPASWIHALAARCSQFALWRDAISAGSMRGTRVVPDIGFGAGVRAGLPSEERDELIVSLRGNRPYPSAGWLEAVRATAAAEGLRIRTVVQVREDEDRARDLARDLGGVFESWGDTDPIAQEARLRERYDRARMAISDRMHVLVLAALSGAVPVELVPHPTPKITAAFSAIGLPDVTIDAAEQAPSSLERELRTRIQWGPRVWERVLAADAQLRALEAEVRAMVRTART